MMTKTELINQLAATCGLPANQVEPVIQAFLHTVTTALIQGDTLSLIGFGTFGVKTRAARTGRHPRSGESMQIPATNVPYFKPGIKLKEAVKDKIENKKVRH